MALGEAKDGEMQTGLLRAIQQTSMAAEQG